MFIVFEGIDGAGKSSHIAPFVDRLKQLSGKHVLTTREPGGTAFGEQVRNLLLHQEMRPNTEVLLAYASRGELLEQTIRPYLQAGACVVCDRFCDSTFAYQGHGHGADLDLISSLEKEVVGQTLPDITLYFDLDPQTAASRRGQATGRNADRFEGLDASFFERVRNGYLDRIRNPLDARQTHLIIDSSQPMDEVRKVVMAVAEKIAANLMEAERPRQRSV